LETWTECVRTPGCALTPGMLCYWRSLLSVHLYYHSLSLIIAIITAGEPIYREQRTSPGRSRGAGRRDQQNTIPRFSASRAPRRPVQTRGPQLRCQQPMLPKPRADKSCMSMAHDQSTDTMSARQCPPFLPTLYALLAFISALHPYQPSSLGLSFCRVFQCHGHIERGLVQA